MCEGIPVAVYLQAISVLIGIVAFVIPIGITIAGKGSEWCLLFRIRNKRHSFASMALSSGKTVRTVGRLLGHGNAATLTCS